MAPSTIFTVIVGIGGLSFLFYKFRHLDRYRREEQAARDHFDQHGHWPEETPEQAAAEREQLQARAQAHIDAIKTPDAEGRV